MQAASLDDVEAHTRQAEKRGYCLVLLPDGTLGATRLGIPVTIQAMLADLREIHGVLPLSSDVVDTNVRLRLAPSDGGAGG